MNAPVAEHDRVLPHAIDAEEAVLGAMLLDREAIRRGLDILDRESFYAAAHRKIAGVIVDLFDRGEECDLVTVGEELNRRGALESVGGAVFLQSLVSNVATVAKVARHARIVQEKAALRRIIRAGQDAVEAAWEAAADPGQVAADFADRLARNGHASPGTIEYLDLVAIQKNGIPQVQWLVPGWLAARENALFAGLGSTGKSTTVAVLAQSLARGAPWCGIAVPRSGRVLVVDQEQSVEEVADLYLRTGGPHPNLRLVVGQGLTIDSQEGIGRLDRAIADFRPDLVILDSAQQVFVTDLNSNDEVADRYRVLNRLRDEYGTSFLVIGHEPKQGGRDNQRVGINRVFGAVALTTQSSTVWLATRTAHALMDLVQVKRRRSRETSLQIRYCEEGPDRLIRLEAEGPVEVAETVKERAAAWIVDLLARQGGPVKRARIVDCGKREGFAENKLDEALALLLKVGRIEKPSRGSYALAGTAADPSLELPDVEAESPL